MDTTTDATNLSLHDALSHWCDKRRLSVVFEAEGYFSERELREHSPGYLGNPRSMVERETPLYTHRHARAREELAHAWNTLIEDFQKRVAARQIYLSGTQSRPIREDFRSPIPGLWATDFKFDFFKSTIEIGLKYRYVAVTGSKTPLVAPPDRSVPAQSSVAMIAADTVGGLSDDVLLALIEEHTKRVVESLDPYNVLPSRVSFMPLIRRKMEYRHSQGETLDMLEDEVKVLARWIGEVARSHQTPTLAAIRNAMRALYRELRAR